MGQNQDDKMNVAEIKSSLRKLEFPACAKEALLRTGNGLRN